MEGRSNSFLETERTGVLMRRYAVPCVISLLVAALYNIVDQIFIANADYLGSYGNASNSVVFPLTVIALALATMLGDGCCALVSLSLGAGHRDDARRSVGTAVVTLVLVSLVLTAVYLIWPEPILTMFGARVNAETFRLSREYFFYIALGVPFYIIGQALNPIIRSDGSPRFAMLTLLGGALTNCALDPLFIYGFHWGMMGAAVATVISQAVSCIWVLRFLSGPKSILPLRRREARIYPYLLKDILSLGVVGFIMKFTNSLVQIACNKMLSIHGGDLYVGVMTVINAIRDVFTLPASGITDGARPVLSYNYGAGQMQRVRAGIRFMSAAAMVYTFCAWLFAMFQPRLLCRIFTPDEAMVEASVRMLRVYFAGFFFQSFQFCGQSVFQSLGWAKYAITFSLLRKVVIVVPLTLLLPVVGLGTTGVFLAEPISNIVGGLACYITMLCTAYKQMGRE